MNKQALTERANALELELKKLREEIAKPSLPEGFTAFEPTELDASPCHPRDTVNIILRNGTKNYSAKEAQAYRWGLQKGCSQYDIIGYKVTKKYVEPRPMKYSELPVGQWFTWGYWSDSKPYCDSLFIKIHPTVSGRNAVVLKQVPHSTGSVGDLVAFEDNGIKFYSVELTGRQGELLTVPSEKK